MTPYARPDDLQSALALMGDGTRRVLAGGTDLYPGAGAALAGPLLDIMTVPGMRGISLGEGLRIGAATTWSDIAEANLPPALAGLQQAALQVGGRQVQNMGTIGGNLCNASPAADGVPPLLTLGASVELASMHGTRQMALADFLKGPRKTALAANEILVAVHVPPHALLGSAGFMKLGARAYMVISIVMVAARLVTAGGIVTEIAMAVGACSPVARRLERVEAALIGKPVVGLADHVLASDVAASLSPIADVRASPEYRIEAALELTKRVIGGLA